MSEITDNTDNVVLEVKKRKVPTFVWIILAVILLAVFGLVYYFVIWDGPFSITPIETSYEINDTNID